MEEFTSQLQETAGTVITLRETFNSLFRKASREPNLDDLSEEHRSLYRTFRSNQLKSHFFSDFVVFSLCLCDDTNRVPLLGVYSILYATAATFAVMLKDGIALRGGIDIGLGLELPDGDVYGPALARAHILECHVAQYPRVVAGDELFRYIQLRRQPEADDVYAKLNAALAERCSKLLTVDDDGYYAFLDYLGTDLPLGVQAEGELIVRKAYDFVVAQSSRYQDEKDSKLAFRYSLL